MNPMSIKSLIVVRLHFFHINPNDLWPELHIRSLSNLTELELYFPGHFQPLNVHGYFIIDFKFFGLSSDKNLFKFVTQD